MVVLHGGPRGGEEVDEKSLPSSTKSVQIGDVSPGGAPVMQDFVFIEVPDPLGNILLHRVESDGSATYCGIKPKT